MTFLYNSTYGGSVDEEEFETVSAHYEHNNYYNNVVCNLEIKNEAEETVLETNLG